MKTNANDPINPVLVDGTGDSGLTKREYFAAKAMQGLLSDKGSYFPDERELWVCAAVKFADALIAELNKEAQP